MNFDHPHMEIRCQLVERIPAHEGIVGGAGVGISAFVKEIFAEIAVNAVLVGALAMAGEVFHHRVCSAEVGKTQADDAEGVLRALAFRLIFGLFKVVSHGNLVIQQRNESIQSLFIELLLVERPAQFIQSQIVVERTDTNIDDARIGIFGIQVAFVRKEVFRTPELHFIDVTGPGEFAHYAVHDLHGLPGPAKFLISA